MTVRDMVQERKREMLDDLQPPRARQLLVEFTALFGNCQVAVTTCGGTR